MARELRKAGRSRGPTRNHDQAVQASSWGCPDSTLYYKAHPVSLESHPGDHGQDPMRCIWRINLWKRRMGSVLGPRRDRRSAVDRVRKPSCAALGYGPIYRSPRTTVQVTHRERFPCLVDLQGGHGSGSGFWQTKDINPICPICGRAPLTWVAVVDLFLPACTQLEKLPNKPGTLGILPWSAWKFALYPGAGKRPQI